MTPLRLLIQPTMRRWWWALALAGGWVAGMGDRAVAFNPEHLRQLFATNQCESCDLSGADLSGQRMDYANLGGANLSGANLSGASLQRALLWGADLSGANLMGADLEGATLSRANLQGANLQSANLERSELDRTNLAGIDLSGADLSDVSFNRTDLSGAKLAGADLSSAELNEANLTNADLTDAILFAAELNGANLTGAQLTGANLDGAKLAGAIGYSGPPPKEGPVMLIREVQSSVAGAELMERGLGLLRQGNLTGARTTWEQALAAYRRDRDGEGTAATLAQLASVALLERQFDRAIDLGLQGASLARTNNAPLAEVVALGAIGNAHYERAEYVKALEFFQQRLIRSAGTPLYHAALLDRAKGAVAIGDYTAGLFDPLEVLGDAGPVRPIDRLSAQISLVRAFHGAGDYNQARRYLALARQTLDPLDRPFWESELWQLTSALDLNQGNFAAALKAANQALTLANSPRLTFQAQRAIGLAKAAQQNWPGAIATYRQAIATAKQVGDRRGEIETLSDLGLALHRAGSLQEAEQALTQAIAGWDDLAAEFVGEDYFKVGFMALQSQVYQRLQDVLLAQNRPEVALLTTERGRSRVFVDLMLGKIAHQQSAQNYTMSPSIASIRAVAQSQQATLVVYAAREEDSTAYCRIYGKICQSVAANPQPSAIDPPPPSAVDIWVVSPQGQIQYRRGTLPQDDGRPAPIPLTDLVGRSRSRVPVMQLPSLRQLHRLLIEPIADLLPRDPSDRVVFVPQGTLFLVPFAALRDAEGQYLIQQHTISFAPSIRVLELASSQRSQRSAESAGRSPGAALVVGNPTMPGIPNSLNGESKPLSPLPGAAAEAQAIAQLLGVSPLTGNGATEAAVKAQIGNANIIHLATHGLLDDYFGDGVIPAVPGALAFTPGQNPDNGDEDDGFLTTEEILNLKLQADLVVLSACDTGRGQLTSDGVIGLTRAFIVAGAPSTIMSLWAVPDEPTSALMVTFYQEFLKSGDRAAALRSAMLQTQQRYPDPVNWAAFALVGAPR